MTLTDEERKAKQKECKLRPEIKAKLKERKLTPEYKTQKTETIHKWLMTFKRSKKS